MLPLKFKCTIQESGPRVPMTISLSVKAFLKPARFKFLNSLNFSRMWVKSCNNRKFWRIMLNKCHQWEWKRLVIWPLWGNELALGAVTVAMGPSASYAWSIWPRLLRRNRCHLLTWNKRPMISLQNYPTAVIYSTRDAWVAGRRTHARSVDSQARLRTSERLPKVFWASR